MVGPPRISIYKLDDDSLLNVTYFISRYWSRRKWQYSVGALGARTLVEQAYPRLQKMAMPHTWVSLTPGYLPRCTRGTPVADMLAHSPLFPPIIDYDYNNHDPIVGDEVGIILAP